MSWKSNYKIPLSFIIFFVLTFFLIGEQLPALPTYLLGLEKVGDGPAKLHILDIGLSDSLHRPFAYIIIGTVIWGLFRIFTWPLAWFVGAALWILEQQTLTPLDQRPTLINAIVFTSTFWVLLTLIPYLIFRWVDKKWGEVGKRNTILIVLAINLLLFGFFAYQIYFLHNSYRDLQKSVSSQQQTSTNVPSDDKRITECQPENPNNPPDCPRNTEKVGNMAYAVYPDTDLPPVLTLFFGKDKQIGIPSEYVISIGQFGSWEGGGSPTPFKVGFEPNSEMEINLRPNQYPIYSFTKGIITNIDNSEQGEITIRFGRKYALKHMHIANLFQNLNVGDKIEAGEFIGYTPIIKAGFNDPRGQNFSFLEIELNKVISNRAARAISPLDYFDEKSKANLEQVRLFDKTDVKFDWIGTTSDKSKSWIPYLGKVETWADMHKMGFEGDLEDFNEFARNNSIEWVLGK